MLLQLCNYIKNYCTLQRHRFQFSAFAEVERGELETVTLDDLRTSIRAELDL